MSDWKREDWLKAAGRCDRLNQSARHVAAVLSTFADYGSGRNARPSSRTLAEITNLKPSSVARALGDLQGVGLIELAGRRVKGRGRPVRVWDLTTPDGLLGLLKPAKSDTNIEPLETDFVAFRDTNIGPSKGHRPPSDLPDPPGGEEEEEAPAKSNPRAEGEVTRAEALRVAQLVALTAEHRWQQIDPKRGWLTTKGAPSLTKVVRERLTEGFTPDRLLEHVGSIGKPTKNATGLLVAHLKALTQVDGSKDTRPESIAEMVARAEATIVRLQPWLAGWPSPDRAEQAIDWLTEHAPSVVTLDGGRIAINGMAGKPELTSAGPGDEPDDPDWVTVTWPLETPAQSTTYGANCLASVLARGPEQSHTPTTENRLERLTGT